MYVWMSVCSSILSWCKANFMICRIKTVCLCWLSWNKRVCLCLLHNDWVMFIMNCLCRSLDTIHSSTASYIPFFPPPSILASSLHSLSAFQTIERNRLLKIPDSIGRLSRLTSLRVGYNKLEFLPETLFLDPDGLVSCLLYFSCTEVSDEWLMISGC